MGLTTLSPTTEKQYSNSMKKYMGFLLVLCGAVPACAQQKWLPAAQAAFGKPAVRAMVGQASSQAAWRVSARLPQELGDPNDKAFSKQLLQTIKAIKITPGQKFTIAPLPIHHFDVDKIVSQAKVQNKAVLRNADNLREIEKLWAKYDDFLYNWLFDNIYKPMETPTDFAYRNNQIVLQATRHLFAKMTWLKNLRGQGRNEMRTVGGDGAVDELIKKLSGEKLIVIGENHYVTEIQDTVGRILLGLKKRNPGRRVVLFTEFMDLPAAPAKGPVPPLEAYFRRVRAQELASVREADTQNKSVNPAQYATRLFAALAKEKIEIYPLEDRTLENMVIREESVLEGPETSALGTSLRNKTWARVLEGKMAEIRRTDPDALFVVYAGKAHTSWVMPYSLPKFFANEHPAVVEMCDAEPADFSTLFSVWTEDDPFFRIRTTPTLHYWEGPLAGRLGKATGFDYMMILPIEGTF